MKVPSELANIYTPAQWKELGAEERMFLSAANWQSPSSFTTNAVDASVIIDYFPWSSKDLSKPSDLNWRELQTHGITKYKTFGPLNAAIDSKADLTVGRGFQVTSTVIEINEFLKDLFNSYRNRLYTRVVSWIVRMLSEGELFLLIALDDTGTATIRTLEPGRIGDGTADDKGLITDLDDVTQTLFYRHKIKEGIELIPDARFILEPEYMAERVKMLGNELDKSLISKITLGKGKFSNVGGYRRFVLHWKNLTGVMEYLRDTASITTTIEWINLYTQALKWELDYRKALCAWTFEIGFDNEHPSGMKAWHLWSKMTKEQRDATGLTKPLTPGSRIWVMPGMRIQVHAPQLTAMSSNNQDMLNLAGAGAKTPQDLFQGQSAGATFASLKSSRQPLVAEIENIQGKLEHFLRYELLRSCFKAKLALGGTFIALNGKTKYKIVDTYPKKWVKDIKNGKSSIVDIEVEPIDMIDFEFPIVNLDPNIKESASAYLGSKNLGIYGAGVSAATITKRFGIDNLNRERRDQLIEQETFGKPEVLQ